MANLESKVDLLTTTNSQLTADSTESKKSMASAKVENQELKSTNEKLQKVTFKFLLQHILINFKTCLIPPRILSAMLLSVRSQLIN